VVVKFYGLKVVVVDILVDNKGYISGNMRSSLLILDYVFDKLFVIVDLIVGKDVFEVLLFDVLLLDE
jgi:hypothetical protein